MCSCLQKQPPLTVDTTHSYSQWTPLTVDTRERFSGERCVVLSVRKLWDIVSGFSCVVGRHGHCVRGSRCENGLRSRHYYILSGSVLSVWTNVERAVSARMQIIRLRTDDGRKIVGESKTSPISLPSLGFACFCSCFMLLFRNILNLRISTSCCVAWNHILLHSVCRAGPSHWL